MIKPTLGILAYLEFYLAARDVSAHYVATLRRRIGLFTQWVGDVPLVDLSCEQANGWLAHVQQSVGRRTAYDYRAGLRCVWQAAYDDGLTDTPPLRLRKIKKPRNIVEAYTHAEIAALLAHAEKLTGRLKDGNRRADFWQAAIHVGYCLGARRGDLLLTLKQSQVGADGVISFVQRKTNFPVTVRLSEPARKFCRRLRGESLLPWPHAPDWFSKSFKRLRKAAGLTRGTFCWIRRSAGSYAEREQPGAGGRLLGHRCERVFRAHYEDRSITQSQPVVPPPL